MKISLLKFISFLLTIGFLSACSGNKNASVNSSISNGNQSVNSTSEIAAQDDVEELGKVIKLPFAPSEATYNESDLNKDKSGGNKKLVAALKFSSADANQIAASAAQYKSPAPADVDAEDWFPPELVAKSQETGDASLKGIEYAPNDFLQPPYTKGRLTRINDTDYFVLELSSL